VPVADLETLKDLLETPFQYTKQVWTKRFDKGKSIIKSDLTEIPKY
jgi:hypothetical protein